MGILVSWRGGWDGSLGLWSPDASLTDLGWGVAVSTL